MAGKRQTKDKKWSTGEFAFITLWRQLAPGMTEPEHDKRFHPERGWRFDFVWESAKVAVEIEGAVWAGGRHTRGYGYEGDCEKYNAANDLGYVVYRYSTTMLKKEPYKCIQQVLAAVKRGEALTVGEDDLTHACGDCGALLEVVRPGKYQCSNAGCPTNRHLVSLSLSESAS